MMIQRYKKQRGQSMTEFVVAAAFVMVPLFIIVPTVGKYIDMKLAAVQAARYVTWEYTAHYVDLRDQPAGFSALKQSRLPLKTLARVQKEAARRFYSNTNISINTAVDRAGYDSTAANPLWDFHNGLPMYVHASKKVTANGSDPTPDKLQIFNRIFGVIGTSLNFIATAYNKLGINAGFDAMNPDGNITLDGLYGATLHMPVAEAPAYTPFHVSNRAPLFGTPLNLTMEAKSGLLTETWGAGGKKHTVYQAGGLIPTLLIGEVFKPLNLQTIASTVLLSPELDETSLKFGYPAFPVPDEDVMDKVPAGALAGELRKVKCMPGQYCVR